jgi:small-conductance mechanosensitive channel
MNATKIMNEDGKVVYIPNKVIANESLENLSRRRYFVYNFRIPFKKAIGKPEIVRDRLELIEGKISEYDPIEIIIKTDIPNANDFVYIFEVKMPEYDKDFDREIRSFLIKYIFPEEEK